MLKGDEIKHMEKAIELAKRSKFEDDRFHPNVGVVVVRENEELACAHRGELVVGEHAEYTVLEKKLKAEKLAGCTVYTTLEPCTARNPPKIPCADRIIERRVERVVIGMLDPDQRITGQGILRLRRAGIAVDLFPPELMAEIEEMNRDFIRNREEIGVASSTIPGISEAGISSFYANRDYYAILRKDAATIDRYVETADNSIIMVSINLTTGLRYHDLCACLKNKLESKPSFATTISLLDPSRHELMDTMAPVLSTEPSELAESIRSSVKNLIIFRQSLALDAQRRLEIKVHPTLPFGSAILLDHKNPNGRIQIETKPYKVGLQRSFAFEVNKRKEQNHLYDTLATSYELILADSKEIGNDGI